MDFRKHLKSSKEGCPYFIPLVDIVLLLVIFLVVLPLFTAASPMKVKLPGAVTSDISSGNNITVIVTSENIFYYNNKVITLLDFRQLLVRLKNQPRPVLIKADRRASVGRIVDLWNLARSLGVERIDVACDRDE